jgi:hypothetical protein
MRKELSLPFDSKTGDTRLLRKDVASDALDDGLGGRIVVQLLAVVFVIDIVANTYKLAAIVRAGQEDDGYTKNF